MANYLNDNEDLLYYFDKGIDWNPLIEVTERGFTDEDGPADAKEALEIYRDIAEMVGKFCADEIAPRAEAIDRKGVHLGEDGEAVMCDELQEIFSQIKDLDLHWMTIPRELGGMNAPLLLYFINSELMARARRLRHGPPRLSRWDGDGDARVLDPRGHDHLREQPDRGDALFAAARGDRQR